jgi:hypothetical protein
MSAHEFEALKERIQHALKFGSNREVREVLESVATYFGIEWKS